MVLESLIVKPVLSTHVLKHNNKIIR
jgi:hypothetical protein